jgi:hypothetical protein
MDIPLMQQVQVPLNMSTIELVMWILGSLGIYKGSEFGIQKINQRRNENVDVDKKEFTKEQHDELCSLRLALLQASLDRIEEHIKMINSDD